MNGRNAALQHQSIARTSIRHCLAYSERVRDFDKTRYTDPLIAITCVHAGIVASKRTHNAADDDDDDDSSERQTVCIAVHAL